MVVADASLLLYGGEKRKAIRVKRRQALPRTPYGVKCAGMRERFYPSGPSAMRSSRTPGGSFNFYLVALAGDLCNPIEIDAHILLV
jgi:hypothetical protein